MSSVGTPNIPGEASQRQFQFYIAIAWGALLGGLTFAVGPISWLSPNTALGAIQVVLTVLLVPGLIGGMAIARNVHAFSLVPAAIINAIFHFGIGWLLIGLLIRTRARFKRLGKSDS